MLSVPAAAALALAALLGRSHAEPQPSPIVTPPAADKQGPDAKLNGETYDYTYAPTPAAPARPWLGRAFVHQRAAADPSRPLPLLVFLHGTNVELIRYRWMGGGQEGDVRRIVGELMDAGQIPPLLLAAPSVVDKDAIATARTSWPRFDLDVFLDATAKALAGIATIDRSRIIVAGHSGAGCNKDGGIFTALRGKTPVHAALVIDGCMDAALAEPLARTRWTTHVVVSWQSMTWQSRPFDDFRHAFLREVKQHAAAPDVLRRLEQLIPSEPSPHDAMVALVLRRWLPSLLTPDAAPSLPCVSP